MSAIDQYKHNCLGFIECPTDFDFFSELAVYELLEDIPLDEQDFGGKKGDILLGGGSGEAPAFRISVPEALLFFTKEDYNAFENYEDLFKAFWTPTEAFKLCGGFLKLGWTPVEPIEFWLAENMCLLLINNIDKFFTYKQGFKESSKLVFHQEKFF